MEDEAKQWIIIRTDLDMPIGKIASQAAHAAMKAAILDYATWVPLSLFRILIQKRVV